MEMAAPSYISNTSDSIRCPQCKWTPDGQAYWACKCGHSWNVFATQARCPACKQRMEMTFCPECCVASPHAHWYTGCHDVLDEILDDEAVPLWLRYGDVR